jgi:hypothetical protein
MLPTTGLVGGRGIGLNLLGDAIAKLSPAVTYLSAVIASEAKRSAFARVAVDCFVALLLAMTIPNQTVFYATRSAWR